MELIRIVLIVASVSSALPQDLDNQCTADDSCAFKRPFVHIEPNPNSTNNHLYLAGMFDVHEIDPDPYKCGVIREKGMQNMEAFLWALRTFRDRYPDTKLLRGVEIGALAFDFCSRPHQAVQYIFNLERCDMAFGSPPVKPSNILSYIGPAKDNEALEVGRILGHMKKTVISPTATSATLSNPNVYKTFLRTQPSDAEQTQAFLAIIKKLNWKHVQIVHSANAYGTTAAEDFKMAAKNENICVVQSLQIPPNADDAAMASVVASLRNKQDTKGVLVLTSAGEAKKLLLAARQKSLIGDDFVWIGTPAWGNNKDTVKGAEEQAKNAITLAIDPDGPPKTYNDFKQYYRTLKPENNPTQDNVIFNAYWEQKFDCNLQGVSKPCNTAVNNLESIDVDVDISTLSTIQAVDAAVHGIEAARAAACGPNADNLCSQFNSNTRLDSIFTKIKKVSLPGIAFQDNGDTSINKYGIYQYNNAGQPGKLGLYKKGEPLSFNIPIGIESKCTGCTECAYINGAATTTEQSSTLSSSTTSASNVVSSTDKSTSDKINGGGNPYPLSGNHPGGLRDDGWIIAIFVLAGLGIFIVIALEIYILVKMCGTEYARWRTMWVGQVLLMGILLAYCVCFAFTPKPTAATCGIIRFGVGFVYAVIFSTLLVKLMIILSSRTIGYLKGIYQILMFLFALLVQIAIDVEWLLVRHPAVVYTNDEWKCVHLAFEDHIISLVYIMFLILVCIVLAIRTHGFITNHREGIFVGMAAGFSAVVWIAWTLVGAFAGPSYEDPATAFGLLICATIILFVMFLPKVRQLNSMGVEGIYLEDDQVDRGSVMTAPLSYKPGTLGKPESVVYVNNGFTGNKEVIGGGPLYSDVPASPKSLYGNDPHALYARHPGSVVDGPRSAPPTIIYGSPGTLNRAESLYSHTNGRIPIRVSNDLSGRPIYPTWDTRSRRAHSEFDYPTNTKKSMKKMKKARSFQNLGAL